MWQIYIYSLTFGEIGGENSVTILQQCCGPHFEKMAMSAPRNVPGTSGIRFHYKLTYDKRN